MRYTRHSQNTISVAIDQSVKILLATTGDSLSRHVADIAIVPQLAIRVLACDNHRPRGGTIASFHFNLVIERSPGLVFGRQPSATEQD